MEKRAVVDKEEELSKNVSNIMLELLKKDKPKDNDTKKSK